jgi:Ca-activated chloride channel homolog
MTMRLLPLPAIDGEPARDDAGLGTLLTERGNLPLRTLDVDAKITGLTARVQLSQGFHNPYDVPLEATYIFPLPDRAAVTAMRMEADGRVIEGVLKERGQARADYDRAIAEGKRASIAEEERPDVFTMRVGNILPGEDVTVRLTLDQPLPYADGEATFRFPLVVAPRYIPGSALGGEDAGTGWAPDTDAAPDASRITPPVLLPGFPDPVRLSIEVDVDAGGLPLGDLSSSLYAVQTEGGHVSVQPGERADRDFVLRLAYGLPDSDAHSLICAPDKDGAEGTFQLTVLPPTSAAPPRPRDLVLVLDRSGSMGGWKMVAARRAAARIVDTLTGADRFAVLAFDHGVERPAGLPSGLVEASDRNRYRAVEHLARMDARGGTEMLQPLTEAVDLLSAADAGRDRVLVLVTDGQVGNEDQLLAALTPRLAGLRVHTVGVDRAVNAGFLTRLAVVGGGRCELVESEDRLDEAAEHIHARICAPLVSGLSLGTDGLDVVDGTVAPARLPALFPGVPLVITGRWRGAPTGAVTLDGVSPDGGAWTARVDARAANAPALGPIWARAHLRDLEDRYLTADRGATADLEKRLVDTSLRFGVLCRFTAYVAVDSRVVTDGSTPHQVTQPVEPASGWDMLAAAFPASVSMTSMRTSAPMAKSGFRPASMMGDALTEAAGASSPAAPSASLGGGAFPQGGVFPGAPRTQGPPVTRGVRRSGRPLPSTPPAMDPMIWLRSQLMEEARRLREATGRPAMERLAMLHDLANRLDALLTTLAWRGVAAELLAPLRELVRALHAATAATVDELWQRAAAGLDPQAPPGQEPRSTPQTRSRGAFWKR